MTYIAGWKYLRYSYPCDFQVCLQISRRKPENFEKKHKNKTWEREQVVTSKNCICKQKCVALLV